MNIFLFEWKKVWKNGAVLKVVLLFLDVICCHILG